jgi:uncharacterized protein
VKICDAYVHAGERTREDHERMSLSGLGIAVEPVRGRGVNWTHPASFADHAAAIIVVESGRLQAVGLQHLQVLAVPPSATESLEVGMGCVEALRPLLDAPSVVGLGALGLGSGSSDNEELLKRQLDLSVEIGLPVVFGPTEEEPVVPVRRILEILADMSIDPGTALVVSGDLDALAIARRAGCWIGAATDPTGDRVRSTPDRLVRFVRETSSERVLICSAAHRDAGDPAAVPGLIRAAAESRIPRSDIRAIAWRNPVAFYGQSGKLADLRQEMELS